MVKVVIIGAAGRMGQALVQCAHAAEGIELAGAVEISGSPYLGRDPAVLAGLDATGVEIIDDLAAVAGTADVAIDFTFHEAVPVNANVMAEHGKAIVIGTTGLTPDESDVVHAVTEKIPIVWAPNMSTGVNLLFSFAERAASILGFDYDVEIVETHHKHKKDAPSGTALRLGEKVAAGRGQNFDEAVVYGREGLTGEKPQDQIGIHSVRSGDVVGEHIVSFAGGSERVELIHRASSRHSFAMGAMRAALWVCGREPGLYDMQDVLGLK